MAIAASELSEFVIRPTLLYLGRYCPSAEALLLGIAASQSGMGSALHDRRGDPELASLVRGLASQHAFLSGPHLELTVNLRYATAIAWMLVEEKALPLPESDDLLGLARIWRQTFQPHARLRDFTQAWQACVGKPALQAC